MIARAPSPPPLPPPLQVYLPYILLPLSAGPFSVLYFKGIKAEKGGTNSGKAATPLTNTQALQWDSCRVATTTHREARGHMATPRHRLDGRGGGNKGGMKEMEVITLGVVTCLAAELPCQSVGEWLCWEGQEMERKLPA